MDSPLHSSAQPESSQSSCIVVPAWCATRLPFPEGQDREPQSTVIREQSGVCEDVRSNACSLLSGHSDVDIHRKLCLDVEASYSKPGTTETSELRTHDGDKAPSSHLYVLLPRLPAVAI